MQMLAQLEATAEGGTSKGGMGDQVDGGMPILVFAPEVVFVPPALVDDVVVFSLGIVLECWLLRLHLNNILKRIVKEQNQSSRHEFIS